MTAIAFFNNKGGVGKTTLICNVASSMATHFSLSVLLVDADPQCNATQLILADSVIEDIYGRSHPAKSKLPKPSVHTLFDALEPIAKGESSIRDNLRYMRATKNRFGIDLLPGHPRVALLEDRLSQAWIDFGSGDIGGARRSNWASALVDQTGEDYDIILFDVGPSLGALNRSVLIGVDYFITPMSCDLFSIMGISNISEWLETWQKSYRRSMESCRDSWGDEIEQYSIRSIEDRPLHFCGYTVQQYVAKSIAGERRATKAYEKILHRIPTAIRRHLGRFVEGDIADSELALGDVPNMYSLVPLAQDAHTPIHGIESRDGLVGAQYSQKEKYTGFIRELAGTILRNLGIKNS